MQGLPHWLLDIKPLHKPSMDDARRRLDSLTKPRGSLGRLEELAIKIAGITAEPLPRPGRKVIVVMAGDHGVVEEGVSAFPSSVTPQMVRNFVSGGAAINVLAKHVGAEVTVVDVGVAVEVPGEGYVRRNVRRGTANMCRGPAMTLDEARRAIMVGAEVARDEAARGARLIGTGDMGIGNTTASTAIICAITGLPGAKVAGRGTGVDDAGLARKIAAIERALDLNQPSPSDALDILHKVGGLEIGALAGLILEAAASRVPVVIDGFISTAAACLAALLSPASRDYMIGSHLSAEPGHRIALETLGCSPLVSLDMRLGEGTGAALAMSLCDASLKILAEMATFEEAGVSR
jgi:nicotinate-nucleotide--dimethylbenzimidazole phosphoribosyltransferase